MRPHAAIGALLTLVGCATTPVGQSFDEAFAAFDRYDYPGALERLEPLACGHSEAREDALELWAWIAVSSDWDHDGRVDAAAGIDRTLGTVPSDAACAAAVLDEAARLIEGRGVDPALAARVLRESALWDPLSLRAPARMGRWVAMARRAGDEVLLIEARTTARFWVERRIRKLSVGLSSPGR